MAKLGRYSADRKKCVAVDAAKTIAVSDCGTIFMVTDSGDAGYTITLPTAAAAGKGWWCKFVVASGALAGDAGDDVIIANGDGNNSMAINYTDDGDTLGDAAANNIAFDNTSSRGDFIEVWTDGSFWYAYGLSSAAGGIIKDQ